MALSSRRAGSSICVCSPAVRIHRAGSCGLPARVAGGGGASPLVPWKDGTPQRVLTQMGPGLGRKQPRRVRAPSPLGRPRPREGERLFPGHPAGPRHAGLVYLPLSPWVCAILWGVVRSDAPPGLRRLFTWGWGGGTGKAAWPHSDVSCPSPPHLQAGSQWPPGGIAGKGRGQSHFELRDRLASRAGCDLVQRRAAPGPGAADPGSSGWAEAGDPGHPGEPPDGTGSHRRPSQRHLPVRLGTADGRVAGRGGCCLLSLRDPKPSCSAASGVGGGSGKSPGLHTWLRLDSRNDSVGPFPAACLGVPRI